jgi:hypothetical protein
VAKNQVRGRLSHQTRQGKLAGDIASCSSDRNQAGSVFIDICDLIADTRARVFICSFSAMEHDGLARGPPTLT